MRPNDNKTMFTFIGQNLLNASSFEKNLPESGLLLRDRLVSAAYRDTRVVGQDLSWSLSTGNFPYLILRITSDGICCFW